MNTKSVRVIRISDQGNLKMIESSWQEFSSDNSLSEFSTSSLILKEEFVLPEEALDAICEEEMIILPPLDLNRQGDHQLFELLEKKAKRLLLQRDATTKAQSIQAMKCLVAIATLAPEEPRSIELIVEIYYKTGWNYAHYAVNRWVIQPMRRHPVSGLVLEEKLKGVTGNTHTVRQLFKKHGASEQELGVHFGSEQHPGTLYGLLPSAEDADALVDELRALRQEGRVYFSEVRVFHEEWKSDPRKRKHQVFVYIRNP